MTCPPHDFVNGVCTKCQEEKNFITIVPFLEQLGIRLEDIQITEVKDIRSLAENSGLGHLWQEVDQVTKEEAKKKKKKDKKKKK